MMKCADHENAGTMILTGDAHARDHFVKKNTVILDIDG